MGYTFTLVLLMFVQITHSTFSQSNQSLISENLQFGGTAYDYMAYREWSNFWTGPSPLQIMKDNGFTWIRAGVLTTSSQLLANTQYFDWPSLGWHNEFWCSREFIERVLHEADQNNLNQSVFFYFSDQATHAGQQIGPSVWSNYNLQQTADAMDSHCFETVNYFKSKGLIVKLYEIGNEIEYGICNFYPGGKITPWNGQGSYLDYLRDSVWSKEAILLKAAINGVRRADSSAQITLHIGSVGWLDGIHQAFYQYMMNSNVEFDLVGLSYYTTGFPPGSPPTAQVTFTDFLHLCSLLAIQTNKKIIVSEFSYPSFYIDGMGSNYPGYPFSEEGQAFYVRDFIQQCKTDTNIFGIFYFYPDYQPAINQVNGAYGLFNNDFDYKLAMTYIKNNIASTDDNTSISSPNDILLYQNYPNPFNPNTKIKFSIPGGVETRHGVSLQIYDVLGNEVAALVDEEKPAGSYELTWNAGNLPSGVYFYRLQINFKTSGDDSFTETKTMVLIR